MEKHIGTDVKITIKKLNLKKNATSLTKIGNSKLHVVKLQDVVDAYRKSGDRSGFPGHLKPNNMAGDGASRARACCMPGGAPGPHLLIQKAT